MNGNRRTGSALSFDLMENLIADSDERGGSEEEPEQAYARTKQSGERRIDAASVAVCNHVLWKQNQSRETSLYNWVLRRRRSVGI